MNLSVKKKTGKINISAFPGIKNHFWLRQIAIASKSYQKTF